MKILNSILLVLDDNDRSQRALNHAQSLAAAHDARLTVVDVKPYLDAYTEALADIMPKKELRKLVLDHRRDQLTRVLARQKSAHGKNAEVKVLDGVPFIEIIREALRGKHDLIVKAAEGNAGPSERIFGSTDMHLMRKSPVPVWLLDPGRTASPERVLAAIDVLAGDEEAIQFNRRILGFAQAAAELSGAELHLLSCWRLVGEETMRQSPFLKIESKRVDELLGQTQDRLTRQQNELADWFGKTNANAPRLTCHREKGEAREVIRDFIKDRGVDVAVMGTVGRAGVPGLLIGNTAESVLSDVSCSVITLKPDGFETPVSGHSRQGGG